jgi:hypothetical protein
MKYILCVALFLCASHVHAATRSIEVLPPKPIQGEPTLIVLRGVTATSSIASLIFDGKKVEVFPYGTSTAGLHGVDLRGKIGRQKIVATLKDGTVLSTYAEVVERKKITAPLGVPEKLGGNSTTSVQKVVSNLEKENLVLANLRTGFKNFWSERFIFPVVNPVVTDPYGYGRETGTYTIAHKGTDFRASKGTKVVSMNRGVVRVARKFIIYGNTVIVDHGLGVMTMYMHLSRINVNEGELVQRGQVIGLSGDTGYAEHPHLHLSIRIGGISIDPMKFMELVGK